MEYKVTFRADGEVVVKVDAPNHEEAKILAVREVDKMIDFTRSLKADKRVQFLNPLFLTKVEKTFYPIMTPHNAHNKDLVNKINELWNNEVTHDRFRIILVAYMQRDLDEMYDWNCFGEASDEKTEKFFDENVNINLVPDSPAVLQDPQPVILEKAAGDLAAIFSPIKYAAFRSILDLDDMQCLDVLREITRIINENKQ